MNNAWLQQKLENAPNWFGHSFSNRYMNWKRRHTIERSIRRFLETVPARPLYVLEIGCFEGDFIFKLQEMFADTQNISFTGIDLSPRGIEFAGLRSDHLRLTNCRFAVMDANRLAFEDDRFDVIISSEVLEHMPDPLSMLNETRRVLKPGGCAILTTPNGGTGPVKMLVRIVNMLAGGARARTRNRESAEPPRSMTPALLNGQTEQDIGCGHISIKSTRQWKALLRQAGFRIDRMSGTGGLFFGDPALDRHRIVFGLSVILDTVLERLPFSYLWSENLQFDVRK